MVKISAPACCKRRADAEIAGKVCSLRRVQLHCDYRLAAAQLAQKRILRLGRLMGRRDSTRLCKGGSQRRLLFQRLRQGPDMLGRSAAAPAQDTPTPRPANAASVFAKYAGFPW